MAKPIDLVPFTPGCIYLSGCAKGGNNTLYAGNEASGGTVINDMCGAGQLTGSAQSGTDLFVFKDIGLGATVGTHNFIEDFSQSAQDKIEFASVAASGHRLGHAPCG